MEGPKSLGDPISAECNPKKKMIRVTISFTGAGVVALVVEVGTAHKVCAPTWVLLSPSHFGSRSHLMTRDREQGLELAKARYPIR